MKVIELTRAEFLKRVYNFEESPEEWKFEGDRPVVVDFFATWCGPCKMLSPILDEMSKEYGDRIYVYKVDVDKEEELSDKFNIHTVPTLLFASMDGKTVMKSGIFSKPQVKKLIEDNLLKAE